MRFVEELDFFGLVVHKRNDDWRVLGHTWTDRRVSGNFEEAVCVPPPNHARTRYLVDQLRTARKLHWLKHPLQEHPDLGVQRLRRLERGIHVWTPVVAATHGQNCRPLVVGVRRHNPAVGGTQFCVPRTWHETSRLELTSPCGPNVVQESHCGGRCRSARRGIRTGRLHDALRSVNDCDDDSRLGQSDDGSLNDGAIDLSNAAESKRAGIRSIQDFPGIRYALEAELGHHLLFEARQRLFQLTEEDKWRVRVGCDSLGQDCRVV